LLNIGVDTQGKLAVGAIGQNTRTGSRIAVFGDSEMFQNGFGLANVPNTADPVHPGNRILAERLCAWLLGLPEEDWPPLSPGFTWLVVDGSDQDWTSDVPVAGDALNDTASAQFNIQQVQGFRNYASLYVLVQTEAPPDLQTRLVLDIDNNQDGEADLTVQAQDGTVHVNGATPIHDAQVAVGNTIELSLPLRVAGTELRINRVCLESREAAGPDGPLDCLEQPFDVPLVRERDPATLRAPARPLAAIEADQVNLRAGPGTAFPILGTLTRGRVLRAVGRNEAADWVQVEDARYAGWVADFLIRLNVAIEDLPVTGG
jgi:hypothetical protein